MKKIDEIVELKNKIHRLLLRSPELTIPIESTPLVPFGEVWSFPEKMTAYTNSKDFKVINRLAHESGPGISSRYPDATKPDPKPRQEPITCDMGADYYD